MIGSEAEALPGALHAPDRAERRRAAGALCLAVFPAGACFALITPLLSVLMRNSGASATEIGVMTAMFPLGVLLMGPFVPYLNARFGALRVVSTAIVVLLLTLPAFPLTDSLALWYGLRIATGVAIAVLWISTESWLNAIVPADERGTWIGLYSASIVAGFVVGPLIPAAVGSEGILPFALGTMLAAAAVLPVFLVRRMLPNLPAEPLSALPRILLAQKTIFLTAAVAGFCEYAAFGLLPVYAGGVGMGEVAAFVALTVFGVGNVLLQVPLGRLLDRQPLRRVTIGLALVSLLSALALIPAGGGPVFWAILILCGGTVYGLYTAGLTGLGQRFSAEALTTANAGFVISYELGALVGPPLAGALMDESGPPGLPLAMGGVCLLLMLFWLAEGGRVGRARGRLRGEGAEDKSP